MNRALPLLVTVVAQIFLPGCWSLAQETNCADGVSLEVPCDSALAGIDRVETRGAACGEAILESHGAGHGGWVYVDGAKAGTCSFTLVMKSGERLDFTAELYTPPGCAAGYAVGNVNEPAPQLCPDAGVGSSKDGGL